ncbi:hypothetical protein [Streptomyces sp. MZ04]|nr:hypothetical protein [Streptomyces sp. MZ04]
MTVKDAVRTTKAAGITDPDKALAYVFVYKVADVNAKAETVNPYLRMGAT